MMPRRKFHRTIFVAAGVYNIAWGIFAGLDPQWIFRFARLPIANYPEIYACLGMVVGLYGLLYLDVARAPEQGWRIAAVGLLGKILGPIGMAVLIATGRWPPRMAVLCLTNDVIWWIPFAMYLIDVYRHATQPKERAKPFAIPRAAEHTRQ